MRASCEILPVPYSTIEQFKAAATRARVYVGDTKQTQWFVILLREGDDEGAVGCCAVREMKPGVVRLKAAFILSEHRGKGLGTVATIHREWYARTVLNASQLEVLAYNASFWIARGYRVVGKLRNGATRLVRNA